MRRSTKAPTKPIPNVSPVQVAAGDVIVVARSDDFFTPDGAEAIRAVVDALESLDQVDQHSVDGPGTDAEHLRLAGADSAGKERVAGTIRGGKATRASSIRWSAVNCFRPTPRRCC